MYERLDALKPRITVKSPMTSTVNLRTKKISSKKGNLITLALTAHMASSLFYFLAPTYLPSSKAFNFIPTKTTFYMIIYQSHRLHKGISCGRSNKFPASFFKRLTQSMRTWALRYLLQFFIRESVGPLFFGRFKTPEEGR